jgi:hypothetical protein
MSKKTRSNVAIAIATDAVVGGLAFMSDAKEMGELSIYTGAPEDVFADPERVLLVMPDEFTDVLRGSVDDLSIIVLATREAENDDNVHFRNLMHKHELPRIENTLLFAEVFDAENEEILQVSKPIDHSDPYHADAAAIARFLKTRKARLVPRFKRINVPENMLNFKEPKNRTPLSNRGKVYRA